ncbi:uncharacterized protein [Rutidosis leptorrhynchoides]|uniref:uncharacterized protein n=1 Tax=Rutidosis leptorrhynchoides TaxID=125765 RepID=UPI003A98DFC8
MALSKGTKLITNRHDELENEETSIHSTNDPDVHMIHSWVVGQRRKSGVLDKWKHEPIIFPSLFNINPSSDPVTIRAHISNYQIGQIYTDIGAGAEVMFEHYFLQLPENIRRQNKAATSPLAGFNSAATWPVGSITLEVVLGTLPFQSAVDIEFSKVKTDSRYNVILGRNAMQKFGAIASTVHGMLKFPTLAGVTTIWTQEMEPIKCMQLFKGASDIVVYDNGYVSPNPKHPDQRIQISTTLSTNAKDMLCKLLAASIDVFVWESSNMTGVPREIAQHRLNVNPNITPVVQKKRAMVLERIEFLDNEVQRLVDANIMKKVKYQTWMAKPMMVKKADGSWRMCVD